MWEIEEWRLSLCLFQYKSQKSTSLSIMFKGIMQTNKTTKGIIKTGVSPQSYDDQWHLH